MRATMVRFGPQLHGALRAEAAESGVSVAQYVREAVIARLIHTARLRGESPDDAATAALPQPRRP